MARTKISEFSATPANNTDIDSINISEGCPPSSINDAIRELMSQLKDFQTGAVGDSFNGPIGSSTASTGAFTTLSATGAITSTLATGTAPLVIASTTKVANLNVDLLDGADWAAPAALGSTTPAAVSATTLSASSTVTLSGGTANGVAYLNGSKVVTSGSALTFDGTTLKSQYLNVQDFAASNDFVVGFRTNAGSQVGYIGVVSSANNLSMTSSNSIIFNPSSAEGMRLTSTGLGIGTSSPAAKLDVGGAFVDSVPATYGGTIRIASATQTTVQGIGGIEMPVAGDGYSYKIQQISNSGANLVFASRAASATWTERMRLDSSGNLGLGVTPSADWASSGYKAAVVRSAFLAGSSGVGVAVLGNNAYNDGGGWRYVATGVASYYVQNAGAHSWSYAASGTAGNAITFTQAMTLTAAGNLGVGVTSPTNKIDLGFTDTTIGWYLSASYSAGISYNSGARSMTLSTKSADSADFIAFSTGTAATERARIDSSGNLGVGQTGLQASEKFGVTTTGAKQAVSFKNDDNTKDNIVSWVATTSGNAQFIGFYTDTLVQRGSITYNRAGGLVVYNTTSDYRAKDITGAVTDSGSVIDSVPVYMGKMHGATQERPMFIAHETPSYAHTGEKDAVDADGNPVYQQMDASALIPVMWAEIQSLRKRLADAGI